MSFSLSATALSENEVRAKVCEVRLRQTMSLTQSTEALPDRRYERSASEVNEAICDCTGGKEQNKYLNIENNSS